MLILTRKPGESLYIGDKIKVTIVEIKGHQIRVGIEAPTDLRIYREEIYLQILEENRMAASAASVSDKDLESLSLAWSGSGDGDAAKKPKAASSFSSLNSETRSTEGPQIILKRKRREK